MKIIIDKNNKQMLKAILIERGYSFPCNGKGICGKCRIIAEGLAPTNLDRRYLTEKELADGYRLACDKIIEKPMIIDCLLQKKVLDKPLKECDLSIVFNKESMAVSVYSEGHISDSVIEISDHLDKQRILSYISKECIELMEFYKVARATTVLISGIEEVTSIFQKDSFDGNEYNLPCEDVYILRGVEKVGSNVLLELISKENGLYLIERDNNLYVFLIKNEEIIAVVLEDLKLKDDEATLFVKAFMENVKVDSFKIISNNIDVAFLNANFGSSIYFKPMAGVNAENCLVNNRYKTMYNKMLKKMIIIKNDYELI